MQQYEYLAKLLIAEHQVAGSSPEDIEQFLDARRRKFSTQALGQVIGELKTTYLTTSAQDDAAAGIEENTAVNADSVAFRCLHQLQFSPERHRQVCSELDELLKLRNEMVHHFIERFDFANQAGCHQGIAELDQSYTIIEDRFRTLADWVESANSVKRLAAAFDEHPVIKDIWLHGILPNGKINWQASTIVALLREAEARYRREEWTLLKDAIEYIAQYPEQTPGKYHCKRWRQLLHESRLFDIRKTREEHGSVLIWYRSK